MASKDATYEKAKAPIYEPERQAAFLAAAAEEGEDAWCETYLMLKHGMHPKNVLSLLPSNVQQKTGEWFLSFKRVKNAKPRSDMLSRDVGPRIAAYVAKRARTKTRQGLFEMVRRVGKRVDIPDASPMTLRHTHCVNLIRRHRGDPMCSLLVANNMGCAIDVVMRNYSHLDDWERQRAEASLPSSS